jgi:transcriptional regulator with XRE-family HTH domain
MTTFSVESFYKIDRKDQVRHIIESKPEYLNKIPRTEREIYDLFVIQKMKQEDIARITGMTQGAVSIRLNKMYHRLLFLQEIDKYIPVDYSKLSPFFTEFEIKLLELMLTTTCQSETAERLNEIYGLKGLQRKMNQVKVRYRFRRYLTILKKNSSEYYPLFKLVEDNLYQLHEVRLPHFHRNIRNMSFWAFLYIR